MEPWAVLLKADSNIGQEVFLMAHHVNWVDLFVPAVALWDTQPVAVVFFSAPPEHTKNSVAVGQYPHLLYAQLVSISSPVQRQCYCCMQTLLNYTCAQAMHGTELGTRVGVTSTSDAMHTTVAYAAVSHIIDAFLEWKVRALGEREGQEAG